MKAPEPQRTTPEVELEIHEQFGAAIVTLRGEHDLNTGARITEALARASEHLRVLVDLSECTFADSSVINALVVAHKDVRQRDGRLEVVIPPRAAARRLAELAHLAEILPVHSERRGVSFLTGGDAA